MQHFSFLKNSIALAFAIRIIFTQDGVENILQKTNEQLTVSQSEVFNNFKNGNASEYELCRSFLNNSTDCPKSHVLRLESCTTKNNCKKLAGLQYGRAPAF